MNLKYSKYIAKYNGVFCAAKKREGSDSDGQRGQCRKSSRAFSNIFEMKTLYKKENTKI